MPSPLALFIYVLLFTSFWGHRGHDRMVVGFTMSYEISAYHY